MMDRQILSCCIVLSVFSAIAAGCTTAPRDFETPTGPQPGNQAGPWIVLGVVSLATSTGSQGSGRVYDETVTVNVPPGTELIVPAMRGWVTGFGSSNPADLSGSGLFSWNTEDHHFGIANVNVTVLDINAVDASTSPPTQTASLQVSMLLSDHNSDDRWFGNVRYTLICLGRHPDPR